MFTNKTIQLSRAVEDSGASDGLQIIRDFNFAYVGKIPTDLPQRLVAVGAASHLEELSNSQGVEGVITTSELADKISDNFGLAICDAPFRTAMDIHEYVADLSGFQWQDFSAEIDASAQIHPTATISEKNVRIGAGTVIGANVVINERVIIGDHCYIGPGSILGFDSFDIKAGSNPNRLLRQSGGVKLEDHVTIKANVTIDRATFGGFTTLKSGACIDNLSYVAHDCQIGANVRIASAVSVNGRTNVGAGSYIGPNAVVSNGVEIGENCYISLGSVVTKSLASGAHVSGNFAVSHKRWLQFIKSLR